MNEALFTAAWVVPAVFLGVGAAVAVLIVLIKLDRLWRTLWPQAGQETLSPGWALLSAVDLSVWLIIGLAGAFGAAACS